MHLMRCCLRNNSVCTHVHPQLLGLNAGQTYKDSTVNQMYDELMSTPLEPGYSQQTVTARADLLSSVLSDIICSKGKKMDKEVVLPYELIPGALAIMAEVRAVECKGKRDLPLHVHGASQCLCISM